MKVAVLIDRVYPFFTGGYERMAYEIFRRLSKIYDITIFTTIEDNKILDDIKFISISKNKIYTNKKGVHNLKGALSFFINVLKNIKKLNSYDIIIINTIPYLGIPYLMKKLKNKKIITIFHEAWYNYPDNYIFKMILRNNIKNIVNKSNYIFSISKATTQSLIKNYNAKNVYTIPLGIDLKMIGNSKPCKINYDVACLGRLSSIKRVDDLIKAVSLIKIDNIKVAIIGDGELKEDLINMAKKLNLDKNINFFGKVDDAQKYSILKSSKIFVMSSEREGFSIATLEAIACGCVPVVAKPEYEELFGISHFIKNNKNGLYYNVGDYEGLSNKILLILNNDNLYKKLRDSAISESLNYSWDTVAERYRNIIDKI